MSREIGGYQPPASLGTPLIIVTDIAPALFHRQDSPGFRVLGKHNLYDNPFKFFFGWFLLGASDARPSVRWALVAAARIAGVLKH